MTKPIPDKFDFWTPERARKVTDLWMDGWSAGQIARQFDSCTRNMIVGKVMRMGLAGHVRQQPSDPEARLNAMAGFGKVQHRERGRPMGANAKTIKERAAAPVRAPPVAVVTSGVVVSLNARVWTERGSGCAWPVGTVIGADQLSCANRCEPGERYCAGHRARMHVAATGAWKADRLMRLARVV